MRLGRAGLVGRAVGFAVEEEGDIHRVGMA